MHKFNSKLQSAMPYVFAFLIIMVTFLMLIELPPKQGGWPHWDKVQHVLVFVMLTLVALGSFSKSIICISAGLIAYGALIEYFQGVLTLTRLPSLGDWLADIAGIVLAILIWLFTKYFSKRNIELI